MAQSIVQVTEIKKKNQVIAFGSLKDLKVVHTMRNVGFGGNTGHPLQRRFYNGNYSVSTIHDDKGFGSSLVIHQENVNPATVLSKLREIEGCDGWIQSVGFAVTANQLDASKPDLLRPSDWLQPSEEDLEAAKDSLTDMPPSFGYIAEDQKRRQRILWAAAVREQISKVIKERDGTNACEEPNIAQMFYLVFDLSMDSYMNLMVSVINQNIYKLQVNGNEIGFALNIDDLLPVGPKYGALFRDPARGYFALVIRNVIDNRILESASDAKFILPIERFLFENEYRQFGKDGNLEENAFYGGNGSSAFDFCRLPDNIFVKILLELPWREQLVCRRVSRRWIGPSNMTLGVSTKIIDVNSADFWKMQSSDLGRLLSIVADGLDVFNLGNKFEPLDFVSLHTIPSFRSLRELNIGNRSVPFDQFFQLLDKCPKLKKLTASIPTKPADFVYAPVSYETVEELRLKSDCDPEPPVTDPQLMDVIGCFPNLSQLCVEHFDYLTESCVSSLAEKYGNRLRHLEIQYVPLEDNEPLYHFGSFTGIGACSSLTYLSLPKTTFVSTSFMIALSTGCSNLTTLDLDGAKDITNDGLSALATLPNLTKLNISGAGEGLMGGIMALAMAGHLKEFRAEGVVMSVECLKTLVRRCHRLQLLDIRRLSDGDLTVDGAKEVATVYGQYGQTPRLIIRSMNNVWLHEQVAEIQIDIKDGNMTHQGRLIVDCRTGPDGFLDDQDDEYEDYDGNQLVYQDEMGGDSDFSGDFGYHYGNDYDYGSDLGFDHDYYDYDAYDDEDFDDEVEFVPYMP